MRPKKRILLAASHEDRASVLKYVFETNGFVAMIAPDAAEATGQLHACPWDLLLCELPFEGAERLVDIARTAHIPSAVLTGAVRELPPQLRADSTISKAESYPALLQERIKTLTARKRGPRPQPKPPASLPTIEAAKVRLA